MHDIDLMLKLQLDGKHEEARAISDKLELQGPTKILDAKGTNTEDIWFRHSFNRGWFLIQEGDYQAGAKLLEHGRFLNVYGSPPLRTNAPIFNPDIHSIKGKSIILSLEGGFGDEIIHARFATSFKNQGASYVYIAAAPELMSLFSRIEGVDGVILRNQAHTVNHDYWIPGFSSGWVAGHTFQNFLSKPYITPKTESVEIWKSLIKSDKVKVGIRWAGNPKFEHQQFRRFPEKFITNLSKYDELQIYSLQRDHNTIALPESIIDLQHFLLSWEDTVAAIANMDIIISSCTSIAHLAAAMGKETWVIVPILPYHTWTYKSPDSTTTPYYDCVKIFRQQDPSNWNDTFQSLYTHLEKKFNLKYINQPNEDRIIKRLNIGCGLKKFNGFLNVDKADYVKPDQRVDLSVLPFPWSDNEFDHIIAKDVLEHLDCDFVKLIKEMYRVSYNGAIWEIQVPHWRCDVSVDDPTHKKQITPGMFNLFNKKIQIEKIQSGEPDSFLSFENDVDIEICDLQFEYTHPFKEKIKKGEISEEELVYTLNHLNNVASATRILIQVHKPGRIDNDEFRRAVESILNKK